jgi:limonene-1,2-epoxide hydrolase
MNSGPATPERVVVTFAQAWDRLDMDAIVELLSPDVVYHNMPLAPLRGRDAVEAYLRSVGPIDSCSWRLLALATSGRKVLTERVDELVVRGKRIVLPVMGIFEVADGLIREWRDYFDLASYRAQWPADLAA